MTWGAKMSGGIRLDDLKGRPGERAMTAIGLAAIDQIMADTQEKHVDENGRPFKRYNKFYAIARKAAGYGTKPDLTLSGHMLNAMQVVAASASSVTVGFIDTAQAGGKTLLQKAWPRLSKSERNAFWAMAIKAKLRAGKSRATGRRRNPTAERNRRGGAIPSGHPSLLPSEKAEYTNKLRPWFGFGKPSSRRRKEIQKRGARIMIRALTSD